MADEYVRLVQDMYEGSIKPVSCVVGVSNGLLEKVGLQISSQSLLVSHRLTDEVSLHHGLLCLQMTL